MDHSELVAQFCAITQADSDTAEQYLQVADNSLENAITLFLEGGGVSLDNQIRASNQSNASTDNLRSQSAGPGGEDFEDDEALTRRLQEEEYANGQDTVRERIQPVTETLVESGFGGGGGYPIPQGIFNQQIPSQRPISAFDDVLDDNEDEEDEESREPPQDRHDIPRTTFSLEETTGMPSMTPAQSRLASIFRPPFDLIRNLDLDQAKELAQTEKKWLLVNIQNVSEFQCQVLNRDLWTNNGVKAIVKDSFIFVQYNHTSPEGLEYQQYYPFVQFPHISVLDPRTGEQIKTWENIPSADTFAEDLLEILANFSFDPKHKNPPSRISKRKVDVNHMTEEDQIRFAMRESLGKNGDESSGEDDDMMIYDDDANFEDQFDDDDNDAESEELGFGGDDAEEDDDEMEIIDTKPSSIANTSTNTSSTATEAPSTPTKQPEENALTEEEIFASIIPEGMPEPAAGTDSTRIQFRLGDGRRIIRRVRNTDTVREIFALVKFLIPEARSEYFSLTSERKKLFDLLDKTVEEAGLKNSTILVEILEE